MKKLMLRLKDNPRWRVIRTYLFVSVTIIGILCFLLLVARVGLISQELRELMMKSELSSLVYMLSLLPAAGAVAVMVAMRNKEKSEETVRRRSLAKAVAEVKNGVFSRKRHAEDDPDNAEVYEQLEKIANEIKTTRSEKDEMHRVCDEKTAYANSIYVNMLDAKASPVMVKKSINGISSLCEQGRLQDISKLANNISVMLDSMIIDTSRTVSLAGEIDMIKRYIDNYEILTGRHIVYRLSIMCNIVEYRTLPHLILPVIDNFISYAEQGYVDNYEVGVDVTSMRDNVIITVRDNGIGMSSDNLALIQNQLKNDSVDPYEDCVTIANINKRVSSQFGSRYGVRVSSSSLGTVVRIFLPAVTDSRE